MGEAYTTLVTNTFPRLFAGISLDEAARNAGVGACQALERAAFNARYEPPEKFHATLAFLGNVPEEQYDEVKRVLSETAGQTKPFSITLDKLGAFPNEQRPRIIFLGSRESPAFRWLCAALRSRYSDLGFTFNDDAILHVTIARIKGGSLRPLPMIEIQPVTMRVSEIVLFESITEQRKTRYEIRTAFNLSGV